MTLAVVALDRASSSIQRGAELAPVPLNMAGLNPALVRQGSYIVNAQGGCNDCHTVPSYAAGGNPFEGQQEVVNAPCYLAGGAAFGPFVSRNLTPRANGLPAGRTPGAVQRDHALWHRFPDSGGRHSAPAGDALAGLRQDVRS
jgi:hypothetical protein